MYLVVELMDSSTRLPPVHEETKQNETWYSMYKAKEENKSNSLSLDKVPISGNLNNYINYCLNQVVA